MIHLFLKVQFRCPQLPHANNCFFQAYLTVPDSLVCTPGILQLVVSSWGRA